MNVPYDPIQNWECVFAFGKMARLRHACHESRGDLHIPFYDIHDITWKVMGTFPFPDTEGNPFPKITS